MYSKAIVYCRVSSEKQVQEGSGLDSQERLCSDYARKLGYEVVKIFREEGVSGSLFDRPAMKSLIDFLDSNPLENYAVVFDDLKRFARDVQVHLQLKAQLLSRGVKLECPNFKFDDTPEGRLIENVTAATAQYERESNKRQVIQKMKSRLDDGFWCFRSPPPGLRYEKGPIRGKILKNVEPLASIYKAAIEKYRDGYLNTIEEVQQFIQKQYIAYKINRPISINGAKNILTELLYTGYIAYEPWNIPLTKGKHDGFISLDTHHKVLDRLSKKAKPRIRKDYDVDFPLRHFVLCDSCHTPLTASWNKGRNKRYPNYWCKNKKCKERYKVIRKSTLEEDFELLLKNAKPKAIIMDIVSDILDDVWNKKLTDSKRITIETRKRIAELEGQINDYLKRATKAKNEELSQKYEAEADKLLREQKSLQPPVLTYNHTKEEFGTAKQLVFTTLNNPLTMWKSKIFEHQRTILNMYFDERPSYQRGVGFGTATLAYPIQLANQKEPVKTHLVEMPGIGPGSGETLKQTFSEG